MHTLEIDEKPLKGEDIRDARIHHDGDWGGMVIFCWRAARGRKHEVRVPGVMVQLACRDAVLREVIAKVEDLF